MKGSRRRRGALLALLAGVAVVGWRVAVLPSAGAGAPGPVAGEVRVAYHVHTQRSDGTGTPQTVAAAARDAGLDVVILTDHGDATRTPDPPRRIDGVLVIDAVEISTWAGHYVALGAAPAPYPLGGTPASVVEDVARLGGVGLVAHPASAKDDLKWRDWDTPFDGVEWLNADSEWRDRRLRLMEALVTYPLAPVPTVTALMDRPVAELGEWDRHAARRPVAGLAAHDAHARLGPGGLGEPYDGAIALAVPSYTTMFRAFSNVIQVDAGTWGREAVGDAATVVAAIRAGRLYSVITGRGVGRLVSFTATSAGVSVGLGEHLAPAGATTFVADTTAGPAAVSTLVCDGRVVHSVPGPRLSWTSASAPGACRLEVATAAAPAAPWIVTNPIYVRAAAVLPAIATLPAEQRREALAGGLEAAAWRAETSAGSQASVTAADGAVQFAYALARDEAAPFAAWRLEVPALAGIDRVVLRASATQPQRLWLQLRTPEGGGQRWGESFYVDATPRDIVVPLARLLSLDRRDGVRVPLDRVTALLLVADTVHARPGASGALRLEALSTAR